MRKTVSKFALAAGVVLAMAFAFSCSEAKAAGQGDFYGLWVQGSRYFEINKESITIFRVNSDNLEKSKYRIVKWEKESNKNFIVYALDEDNGKIDFEVSIDAYSDLHISFLLSRKEGRETYEAKKSSDEKQKELNKAIAAKEAAKEAIAQKAAKAVVQRGSFSDQRDGKTYKTVKIGSQTWMAENLNYDAKGSVCYGNQPNNCTNYGRLYNWATAKSACPSGWHLPSDKEWPELVDFAGGEVVAGTYLKAKSGWNDNEGVSGNGTDNYGFSALPGGYGSSGGSFYHVGNYGIWWSANERSSDRAYNWLMHYNAGWANWGGEYKSHLQSVRCVQD